MIEFQEREAVLASSVPEAQGRESRGQVRLAV